jgi:hypothetical protein
MDRPHESEDDALLDELQHTAFQYFIDQTAPENGLGLDSTWEGAPSSIAAVGFGFAVNLVGVERGWLSREEGVQRTLVTLRFYANSHQGQARRNRLPGFLLPFPRSTHRATYLGM